MNNLTISPMVDFKSWNANQNNQLNSKRISFGVEADQNLSKNRANIKKKDEKWNTRDYIDLATAGAYVGLFGISAYFTKSKNPILRATEAAAEKGKIANAATSVVKDKCTDIVLNNKDGFIKRNFYNLMDTFGKLKENSEELTNNMIYGFGTLFVMPLVILFSPIGKKDATPEDRFFTVLRQPISFATVFSMQLAFNDIFKNLIKNINNYGKLDDTKVTYTERGTGVKHIDEPLEFNKVIKGKNGAADTGSEIRLGEAAVNFIKENPDVRFRLNDDILKNNDGYVKYLSIFEKKGYIGRDLSAEEFKRIVSEDLIGDQYKVSDKSSLKKIKELFSFGFDKLTGEYDGTLNGKKINKESLAKLDFAINDLLKVCLRNRALKEVSVIIANSFISQALGIMMLNVIYGKMMKGLAHYKEKIVNDHQKKVNGGAQ